MTWIFLSLVMCAVAFTAYSAFNRGPICGANDRVFLYGLGFQCIEPITQINGDVVVIRLVPQ